MTVDRRQLAERAFNWIADHRDEFLRLKAGDDLHFLKRLGELGETAGVLLDHESSLKFTPAISPRALLALAWQGLQEGELLRALLVQQPRMAVMASIYPVFHRHGLCSEPLREAIANAVDPVATPDSVRLLLAGALELIGLDPPWRFESLAADTPIGREAPTWALTQANAYVATHQVFHWVNAGSIPDAARRYLKRAVPVWIASCASGGSWDLLAEMIGVAHCVDDACVPDCEWEPLASAQHPDGSVAFRRGDLEDDAPRDARFRARYHSTLTTVMACARCHH